MDICSPTWFSDRRVGRGKRAGGGLSKGWPIFYFRSHSSLNLAGGLKFSQPCPSAGVREEEEG